MTMNEEHEIPALTFCKSLILLGISPTEFGGIATAIMGLPLVWNINFTDMYTILIAVDSNY